MAHIFISFFSFSGVHSGSSEKNNIFSFYEGFIKSLTRYGNKVMVFNAADYNLVNQNLENITNRAYDKDKIDDIIRNFAPDIVVTFNNASHENILNITTCPIIVYDADHPSYFWDKEKIKENIGRYTFFSSSHAGVRTIKEFFGAQENQVHFVPLATAVQAENLEQDKNISFIGTRFVPGQAVQDFIKKYSDEPNVRELFSFIRDEIGLKHSDYIQLSGLKDEGIIEDFLKINEFDLMNIYSSDSRIETLHSLTDLGLYLYGTKSWLDLTEIAPSLALAYRREELYNLKHNQNLYNSSKICFNISHYQAARTGFPWRIMDIMASNGCLVTDDKPRINEVFNGKIKLPTYKKPSEARSVCKEILDDEAARREIVTECQKIIDENFRWEHRFKEIESILGIQLLMKEDRIKSHEHIIIAPPVKIEPAQPEIIQEVIAEDAAPTTGEETELTGQANEEQPVIETVSINPLTNNEPMASSIFEENDMSVLSINDEKIRKSAFLNPLSSFKSYRKKNKKVIKKIQRNVFRVKLKKEEVSLKILGLKLTLFDKNFWQN